MTQQMKDEIVASIQYFRLPSYTELPDTGLLEQVTSYISEYLAPLEDIIITSSMISNYVKKGLIANPVRKQYNREQIAYLFFIAIAKSAMSLEDILLLISLQKKTYSSQIAYDYLCSEFENVLHYVFGIKDTLDIVGIYHSDEKILMRNTIITVAHKIYLDKCLSRMKKEQPV